MSFGVFIGRPLEGVALVWPDVVGGDVDEGNCLD
jgi:hypothetical protein